MDNSSLYKSLKDRQDHIERNVYWINALGLEGGLCRLEENIDKLITLLEQIGLPKPASDENTQALDTTLLRHIAAKLDHLATLAGDNGLDP